MTFPRITWPSSMETMTSAPNPLVLRPSMEALRLHLSMLVATLASALALCLMWMFLTWDPLVSLCLKIKLSMATTTSPLSMFHLSVASLERSSMSTKAAFKVCMACVASCFCHPSRTPKPLPKLEMPVRNSRKVLPSIFSLDTIF